MKCPHCGMTHTFVDDPDGACCLICGCIIYFDKEVKLESWRPISKQLEMALDNPGYNTVWA